MPNIDLRRESRHPPGFLFDLVADIERYPEFLPVCTGAGILSREGEVLTAELALDYRLIHMRFASCVRLDREVLTIEAELLRGPFRHLTCLWRFFKQGKKTEITISIDYEFSSFSLRRVAEPLMDFAVRSMVRRFEERADALAASDLKVIGAGKNKS